MMPLNLLYLRVDNRQEMSFESRFLRRRMAAITLLLTVLLGVRDINPSHLWAEVGIYLSLALILFVGTLWGRRLRLDLSRRVWVYQRGWLFSSPASQGTFDDIGSVVLQRLGENEGGLTLEMRDWPDRDEIFIFGTLDLPADADKPREYAWRLDVPLIDRET